MQSVCACLAVVVVVAWDPPSSSLPLHDALTLSPSSSLFGFSRRS